MTRIQSKINSWYSLASAGQRARGHSWYPTAHKFCRLLATDNGITLPQAAGVVSALSPACYWDLNKRQAEALCNAHASNLPLEDVVVSTYTAQKRKAIAILRLPCPTPGRIERILGTVAWKTRAFFHNMLHAKSYEVTIDRHILSAIGPLAFTRPTSRLAYNGIAHEFRIVANTLHIPVRTLQAIVWIAYKETVSAYSPVENHREVPF